MATRLTRMSQIYIFSHENSTFARFPRASFIFAHFAAVFVLKTTCRDLFLPLCGQQTLFFFCPFM